MLQTGPGVMALPTETEVDVEIIEDADALIEADLLVEDVSIDGMCGVY